MLPDDRSPLGTSRTVRKLFIFGCLLLSCSVVLAAAAPGGKSAMLAEVKHLLTFVEASDCQFNRNDTWHDSKEARAHLETKFDYLAKRNAISNAEDFITRAATKSSLSDREYQIRCPNGKALTSARWQASTAAQIALLESARVSTPARRYDARELDGLPAPVQRYFRAVLKDGQPFIAAATFELTGTINMSATGGNDWKPFTSTQRAVTHLPGFLWNGRVAILPGLVAHVHDSYIAGVGTLHAALLGLFTVAEVQGGGEIARGELMRYFAEMAWYPTALLPSQGVRWAAVDDRSANATLVDGPISLTLLFRFDEAGLIASGLNKASLGKPSLLLLFGWWWPL